MTPTSKEHCGCLDKKEFAGKFPLISGCIQNTMAEHTASISVGRIATTSNIHNYFAASFSFSQFTNCCCQSGVNFFHSLIRC
jgi:hypothetical protein